MRFVVDFHIHSRYSRATSKDMDIPTLSKIAKMKGIDVLGTGDFTHHLWLEELKRDLEPDDQGLFYHNSTCFILTAEVCNIYSKKDRLRKIHNIIIAPNFKVVDEINHVLARFGKLSADGRPILKLDAEELVKIIMDISEDCLVVPGHIWTPWFSLFGANSGFDSIEECFGSQTENIYALETGLSSDPAMNWRWSKLDRYRLISNSDSHSPSRIGREANIFDTELDYGHIINVLKGKGEGKFLMTVEFFPEEGKYHYDGHRNCGICFAPDVSRKNNNRCPKCGRPLTVGVMHRVENLSDRPAGFVPSGAVPFKNLIPLDEIIASGLKMGVNTAAVKKEYDRLIQELGSEFDILLNVPEEELQEKIPEVIAEGIIRVRQGKVSILPGYDGEYGQIKIFGDEEQTQQTQLNLF